MQTLVLNVDDEVSIGDISSQLKELYPSLRIVKLHTNASPAKKFTGIDDLKPLYVPGFKMYSREELHDR